MFFSGNFISRKFVFIWLFLISSTVLVSELAQRDSNAQREQAAVEITAQYPHEQAINYKTGELRGAVSIKQPMDIPLTISLAKTSSSS